MHKSKFIKYSGFILLYKYINAIVTYIFIYYFFY